jgi:hypothetical protein
MVLQRTQEATSKTPKALAVHPTKTRRSAGGLLKANPLSFPATVEAD